jgi:hypothetical protein
MLIVENLSLREFQVVSHAIGLMIRGGVAVICA